jgi:hypothetical protein
MTPHVLSFPCPYPLRLNDALRRVLETDPRNVYNPCPDIAHSQNYRRSYTQPLSRILYLPYDASRTVESLNTSHEYAHLHFLDFTPFKAWGRIILCLAYACIGNLLRATEWNAETQEAWNFLNRVRHDLGRAYNAVALSEELLANAICFVMCAEPPDKAYEKVVIQKAAEDFPAFDFEGLYYRTFKPFIMWHREEPVLLQWLGLFLQAIGVSKDCFEVIESQSRCELLDNSIKEMRSAQQAVKWITQVISMDEASTILAYKAGLVWLIRSKNFKKFNGMREVATAMHMMTNGRKMPRIVFNIKKYAERLGIFPAFRPWYRLYPREISGQGYIGGVIEEQEKKYQGDALRKVAMYESLFEQLTRNPAHFFCPHYVPGTCSCPLSLKQSMTRLSQWITEGKFGTCINRRDIPSECCVPI